MKLHSLLAVGLLLAGSAAQAADDDLPDAAAKALHRGVEFFHQKVAKHGGYVYLYSADLAKSEGEGVTGPDTVWVQPPGTPAVGLALLDVYDWTRDEHYLALARQTGECLRRGQLASGGWDHRIDFAPEARKQHAYRVDGGHDAVVAVPERFVPTLVSACTVVTERARTRATR